eukprot:5326482-Amphidinium_carterae.1
MHGICQAIFPANLGFLRLAIKHGVRHYTQPPSLLSWQTSKQGSICWCHCLNSNCMQSTLSYKWSYKIEFQKTISSTPPSKKERKVRTKSTQFCQSEVLDNEFTATHAPRPPPSPLFCHKCRSKSNIQNEALALSA